MQMNCATFIAIFDLMYSMTDLTIAKGSRDLPRPEYSTHVLKHYTQF